MLVEMCHLLEDMRDHLERLQQKPEGLRARASTMGAAKLSSITARSSGASTWSAHRLSAHGAVLVGASTPIGIHGQVPAQQRAAGRGAMLTLDIGFPGQKDNTEGASEDAAWMRAIAGHDGPTSPRYVCESPGDRWSCGTLFCSRFRRVDAFRFLAEPKCPIHSREFPAPAAVAQRFRRDGKASKLFRLGPIILWFRLHGRHSGCGLVPVNV